jgi:carboxyl-terminal processing protease
MNNRAKYWVVSSSTVLVLLLIFGNLMGNLVVKGASTEDTGQANVYRHFGVYTEVLSRIKSEYVEEPDMKTVTLGAINGLLESIDPFASYLNADQYKEYLKNFDAYRGDVGMVLAKKYGYIAIVDVVPGSPAAEAGLSTGDMIETIKGVATRDMPLAYASLLLRGQPGTTIDLTVLKRRPEPQKVTLTRVASVNPALESKMLEGQIGYIAPETLNSAKVEQVAAALKSLQAKGAKKIILDLRNCGTGEADAGVDLANLFLDKKMITYAEGQRYKRHDYMAEQKKQVSTLPLVVITNRGTASGAEVAAAALGEDKRADLVGERTYGDASILRTITMDDGSAVILSVAKFYGPDGKAIQDIGVTPGTLVAEPDSTTEVDQDGEPIANSTETKPTDDLLLKKAIEVVSAKS